jgi:ribosome-binding ATPase YchF (GTP1/OBG family)
MPAISEESLRDASYVASLRVVDAFAQVLRLFEDDAVPHEKVSQDPLRDLEDGLLGLIKFHVAMIARIQLSLPQSRPH